MAMTRQLAVGFGPKGVRVNSISPGTIATPMNVGIVAQMGERVARAFVKMHPIGRIGEPEEVAEAAVYPASDLAGFTTDIDPARRWRADRHAARRARPRLTRGINRMDKARDGRTILAFSHLLQGPFATRLPADMGAKVIKIERAGPGDQFRSMTFFARSVGGSEGPISRPGTATSGRSR
jgi:hypothetical protein